MNRELYLKLDKLMISCGKLFVCVGLVIFNFSDNAVADGPWTADLGFTSVQGANQWYFQQRPKGGGTATNLAWTNGPGYSDPTYGATGYYQTTDASGWIYWTDTHPGKSADTIRKWVAPSAGTISITSRVYKIDTGGGQGVVASVEKNGSSIWSKTLAYNDGYGYATDSDLSNVSVASGDAIAFIVDENGTFSDEQTRWDPTITKLATYQADLGFSSVQGQNQWYFQQRPRTGGSTSNMTWTNGPGYSDPVHGATGLWITSEANNGWIYWSATHPGQTNDTIRKWVAPSTGMISITGRAYKIDTGGGAGIVASVEKNGTAIWTKTVAYNDATGYTTDAALGNVSVTSGDAFGFVVDDNGTWSNDWTGWDPVVSIITSTAPAWSLNTSDTLLTLSIVGKRPAITRLEDSATNWNWVPYPLTIPLINNVYIASTKYNPNWSYTTAAVDTSNGTMVTLTFSCTTPSLTLQQCWWAHPGPGPVEENTSITNNSGGNVTYNDIDVIAADLTVTSDADVTLWRFTRANSYNRNAGSDASDSLFTTGALKDAITSSASIISTVSNTVWTGPYVLGFTMLDVPSTNHGLYIGYTPDFGIFNTTTSGNAHKIRNLFYLWNSNSFTSQATGSTQTINLPGIFLGAYKGDTDTGSNKMKKWFWTNKITPTIKSTTNEPLVEFNADGGSESFFINTFFQTYPLVSWGVELVKEDALWGDDQTSANNYGYDWNYNSTSWPNGMTLGSIVHSKPPLQLSLYMANTYNNLDLSTHTGVTSEEGALLSRFDSTATGWVAPGYDYWRGDNFLEADYDYLSHLGLMQVLDYMISSRSGFRWENCTAGGTKGKSFDLLQRQSFMNTNDNGFGPAGSTEYYRMSFYSNSYVINPVQLQDQANCGPTFNDMKQVNYVLRTGLLGGLLWGGGWPYSNSTYGTVYVPLFKTYQRPILRGADVYHILPIADMTNWDGIEFFNSGLGAGKGSVLLFKPNSSVGNMSGPIYLKGLIPTNTYSLTFQDRTSLNSSYASVTGSALMLGGTGIGSLSGTSNEWDSEIIWINY